MYTKKISISVALIQDGSSYICLQRKNKLYNNYIEFPGGKLLSGETESDCLIREIKEELDINVSRITDKTHHPHNGCRAPKRRRV